MRKFWPPKYYYYYYHLLRHAGST